MSSFKSIKIAQLKNRLDLLVAQYEATNNQLITTLNAADKIKLEKSMKDLEKDIAEVEAEIKSLEPGNEAASVTQPQPKEISLSTPKTPIEVFFSYSHKDETLRDELADHLAMLKNQGLIKAWHDREITASSEWAGAIDEHLESAQIILLLISASFLASKYCHDIEMKRAMERHEQKEARVIPIILRPVDWTGALFGKLQALPKNAKPVTSWTDRDEAFTDVAKGIRRLVEEMNNRPR